jgi:ActR/RegA family two-component response regulator
MSGAIKVLIVDDNEQYRQAFCRNLAVQGMETVEAEDAEQALGLIKEASPDVMVTDLQMRTATEGLDLVRDTRALDPTLPIIMISAVGSFDEGAMASRLGAAHVLSKARIEEEISLLYDSIEKSHSARREALTVLEEISGLRAAADGGDPAKTRVAAARLREIMDHPDLDSYVKSEAFDAFMSLDESQAARKTAGEMGSAAGLHRRPAGLVVEPAEAGEMEEVDRRLRELAPNLAELEPDTVDSLRMGEYLFQRLRTLGSQLEISRTTCFSYCFGVENQAKAVLRRRLVKFLSVEPNYDIIKGLQEKTTGHINIFFQQHLLQTIRDHRMDFTIDNVRLTFQRILEHRLRYRPDGLKALGIILLVFGRTYEFQQFNEAVRIDNPLGVKGFDNDEQAVRTAQLLINLQHFRNPYIHPEIRGQEAISMIRETTGECLALLGRLR